MNNAKEIIEAVAGFFNTGELSDVEKIFGPNYIDHQKPDWIENDGPEEFKQIVVNARKWLPNLRVTIKDLITQGDSIATRLNWQSLDQFGKKIERETLEILHLENGFIVEHWGAESWRK